MKRPPFALIAPKYETSARKEAQKQNINTCILDLGGAVVEKLFTLIINTFLKRD